MPLITASGKPTCFLRIFYGSAIYDVVYDVKIATYISSTSTVLQSYAPLVADI